MQHFKFFVSLLLVVSLGSVVRAAEPPAKIPAAATPVAPAPAATTKIALEGLDAVSYQNSKKPVPGSADHSLEWEGQIWYFATDANRATFMKDPRAYAPQYEGDCACMIVTEGKRVPGNPKINRVLDGKLYLFYDKGRRTLWDMHPSDFIREGNAKGLTLYHTRF